MKCVVSKSYLVGLFLPAYWSDSLFVIFVCCILSL